MTEPRLRTIVAAGQWSSSWMIAVALVFVIFQITPPDWLTVAVVSVFAVTAPTFLVGGMILCVRLPGWRKWVGLTANTFLVVAGVLLMNYAVSTSARSSALTELERVHESSAYKDLASDLAEAKDTRAMWKKRVDGLDTTWVSAAAKPSAEYDKADASASVIRGKMSAMEPAIPENGIALSLRDWVGWLALILAVSNEAVALCLMWGASEVRETAQTPRSDAQTLAQSGMTPEQRATYEEDKYTKAETHLKAQGQRGGYRAVAELLKIPEGRARAIMERRDKRQAASA